MSKHLAYDKVMNAVTVAQAGTEYTDSLPYRSSTGNTAVLVTSSAGSITITQQCSTDNINWYDPVGPTGTGLGPVYTTMTVGTKYIIPALVVSPFIRFKVVETNVAGTVVTLTFIYQQDATH